MTKTTTVGIFPNKAKAESVIENLKEESIHEKSIKGITSGEKWGSAGMFAPLWGQVRKCGEPVKKLDATLYH